MKIAVAALLLSVACTTQFTPTSEARLRAVAATAVDVLGPEAHARYRGAMGELHACNRASSVEPTRARSWRRTDLIG